MCKILKISIFNDMSVLCCMNVFDLRKCISVLVFCYVSDVLIYYILIFVSILLTSFDVSDSAINPTASSTSNIPKTTTKQNVRE